MRATYKKLGILAAHTINQLFIIGGLMRKVKTLLSECNSIVLVINSRHE